MTLALPTAVADPATQQCLDEIAKQFPIQQPNLAGGAKLSNTLPSKAALGTELFYLANKVNGVRWHLVFDGEGTYPWKKVGGPPLFATGAGGANSAETYSAVGSAAITLPPVKMLAEIQVGATSYNGTNSAYSQTALKVGAAAAEDFLTHHQPNTGGSQHGGEANATLRELAAGTTVKTEIRQLGGGTAQVFGIWLKIDPVCVG